MEDIRDTTVTTNDEISLLDLALVVAENLRTLVFLPLVAGLVALAISFSISPTFTATTTLLPPQQQQSLATALASQLGALAGPAGAVAGIKNPADMYVAMLQSRTVADKVIERYGLKQLYRAEFAEQARKELKSRTKISTGRDGLIVVSVDDHSPKRAADLANAYVEALFALTQTLAVTEAGQRRLFFERQLKEAKNDLTNAEIALRGAGINEAVLNTVPESAFEFVASLKARVTAQEIKLASMRGFMTDSNPEFRQAQVELAALREQLAKTEQNGGAKVKGRGTDYIARLRDFKYHETLFGLIAKQYELARLDEARESAVIQVVDTALAPDLMSKPRKTMIAVLTALAVFFLVLLTVFVRQGVRNAAAHPQMAGKLARLRQLLQLRRG
jgi:tyrosine-protein kinase Etk/Wzc